MELPTIGFLLVILLLLPYVYRLLNKPFEYWKKRGVPAVPAVPIIGSLYDFVTKKLHEVELKRYQKYGRIHGLYESTRPVLTVGDPELLRSILVKDFQFFSSRRDLTSGNPLADKMVSVVNGEDWKRIRTVITPAFSTGKIKKMFDVILDSATDLGKSFKKAAEAREPVDAKRLFGAFTMDVIASAAFATKLDSHNDPDNIFVQTVRKAFMRNVNWRSLLVFIFPWIQKLFRIDVFAPEPMNFFRDVTLKIVQERKRTGNRRNDFLQLMMDAAEESEKDTSMQEKDDDEQEKSVQDLGHEEGNQNIFKLSNYKGKRLSHDELVANCIIFFFAGYDTTASTLSFASYLLALNPHCQEKLIQDVDEAIRQHENKLTYDGVQSMKYLDMVIQETLRLYPPAVRTERRADADYKLGDTGIVIPKGMIVGIPVYAMHHDPEFFPEPEEFKPERFSPEEKSRRDPYTFLTFGAGPRNCLGMRFALFEIKICLAYILSQFRFKRCARTKVPLDFFLGQGLLQPKEIILEVEARTDKVLK